MEKELVLFDQQSVNAVELFVNHEKLNKTLEDLKEKVMSFVPDVSTATGRKNIASLAFKVAQSKTWLIGEGKKLTADWREKTKQVNAECNQIETFLDDLKIKAREPLTLWEVAEAKRIKAEADAAQFQADWAEAIKEDEVFNLKAEIARRDAEAAKIEAERLAKEQAEREEQARKQAEIDRLEREKRAEAERVERERRIAEEAKAKAEADAKAATERAEQEAAAKLEAERIASAKRIAEEQIRAQMEIKAAQDKAEAEKQAIIQAQQEKERKEAERIAEENRQMEKERIAEEKRQANKKHQAKIKAEAAGCIIGIGIELEKAQAIVEAISSGKIKHVTINY